MNRQAMIKDAFWTISGQLLSALALLGGIRLLTELTTPAVYGQVALYSGFVALGVGVFAYPFICAGMRMLPECQDPTPRQLLMRQIFGLTSQSVLLAALLLMAGGAVYSLFYGGDDYGLLMLTGLLLAATVRRELGVQLLIAERKHRQAGLWQLTESILRPGLAILLVWQAGNSVCWILIGYTAATVLTNLLACGLQSPGRTCKAEQAVKPAGYFQYQVLSYALPLIPLEFIYWLNGLGDRYLIGMMLTAADVGLYVAAYTIINEAFNRGAMVLLRIFQPVYFQLCSTGEWSQSRKLFQQWLLSVCLMTGLGVLMVVALKSWLAQNLLAQPYQAAADLMVAIALGCSFQAMGTVVSQPLLARKTPKQVLYGRIGGVLAAMIAIPVMVNFGGLAGAAWANPIYFGIEALLLTMLAKPWRAGDHARQNRFNFAAGQPDDELYSLSAAAD